MRSKLFLGVVLGGCSLASLVTACGDGGSDTTSGAGGTGTTTATTSTSSSSASSTTSSTGPTSGTGGGSSACKPAFDNHSADKAAAITVNDMAATASCIENPSMSKDYYKFDGMAGESIA